MTPAAHPTAQEIDYVCAEYPYAPADGRADEPATHTFPSEREALDFVRKDPSRRAYRGAQRRLFAATGEQ